MVPDSAPLGLGLVGAGGFGVFCLAAFAEMPEIRVVAVADTDLERAQAAAPEGARVYGDYRAMLDDPAVQIVAINTPPHLHAGMVQQAAAAGKHIFVEKPLATSLEQARTAVQAARAAGVQITVDYVLRFHPLHRLAAEIVRSGALGSLQHWSLENLATDEGLPADHWFWDQEQSGGIHVEHGVHFFDLCNHLVGAAPDAVSGWAQRRPDGRIDRVSATVHYGDDVLATFYHSFTRIREIERTTIQLNYSRGSITLLGWIPTDLILSGMADKAGLAQLARLLGKRLVVEERFQGAARVFRHGGAVEQIAAWVRAHVEAPNRQGEYKRAIQAGMRSLTGAIRGDEAPLVSAEDGLLSLAVALAATESNARQSAIPLACVMEK